ncbi:hypothetical protein HYW99_01900, partial [Candidatus Woesearchaeota archaeon]|nr:hypothetical protein [Candidatus Woesearchaeota archaeon]
MNCLRSLVYIKKIDNKYKQYGLETIIIHPPEWEFEKNVNNIIYALKRYNIKIPLIIDKNKKIIKRLKINFWPTQILIKNRKILYKHIGEGDYKNLENKIIKILKIKTKKLFNKEPRYSKFPAIYLGKRKKAKITRLKSKLKFGIIHTKGNWLQKDEFLCSIGKEESSLLILTKGKITNFVVRSINKKIINVKVNL